MKIINLQQGTPEWHHYRKTRIGASDFAVFAAHKGLSKKIFADTSINSNIYNKINNIQKSNKYLEAGKDAEIIGIENYNKECNAICMPTIIQSDDDDRIFASLDGYCIMSNKSMEYKYTTKSINELEYLKQYYIYQLAHQMYVMDSKEQHDLIIDFIDVHYHETIDIKNLPISKKEWLELCLQYLELFQRANNQDIIDKLNTHNKLREDIKQLEQQKKIIENDIFSIYTDGVFGNYTITKYIKKSYKYAEYVKDNNFAIDDKYCTVSTAYKITNKKDKE